MRILVTGGAGFIGSALVRQLIRHSDHEVLVLDALTYAGTMTALAPVASHPRYRFVRANICDAGAVQAAIDEFRPDVITHLAAETHVDRSIDGPRAFIHTNILGTFTLVQAAHTYWRALKAEQQATFRFHHISTDEVFGSLGEHGAFTETTPYDPRSPYSASKASSDHIVAAWGYTYKLPILITNCSNNYGPYHFPEKMIPLMIVKALGGEGLPVYGHGENVRDWLFVEDHARALQCVFEAGVPGRRYMIGGGAERRNIEVVETLCGILDRLCPRQDGRSYAAQIEFVADRPGHDLRYAVDASRIQVELGWKPHQRFESGLEQTVQWYLDNEEWWSTLLRDRNADVRRGLVA